MTRDEVENLIAELVVGSSNLATDATMQTAARALRELLDAGDAWRRAVDDMLSTQHEVASDDPRESIDRLINWHVQVALDPAVSSDAQALIDRGRAKNTA